MSEAELLAAIKHGTKPLYGYYINDIQVSLTVKNHIFSFLFNMKQYQSQEVCKATKTK